MACSSKAPASQLGPIPGRGSPRSSVVTEQALFGTSLKAELEVVMASVCGPFDPLPASVSGPMDVELETLVEPKWHVASDETLYPWSVIVPPQLPPAAGLYRRERER